jgi:ubiquinone/menaquinone biosynthesis C-methylase UbiE
MALLLLCPLLDTSRREAKNVDSYYPLDMIKIDLELQAFEVLERTGINRSQLVLDFGCGSGMYTIPAAKIVGEQGRVYALDKDKKALDELVQKAESIGLRNIERMDTSRGLEIDLPDESVDVVLLFDVFHSYYFPQTDDRRNLLNEIHRIMKSSAFVSVWPKHMESEAKGEIESANFYFEREYSGTLIHNNKDRERGQILNFKKRVME